jgi:hypothetical protein
MPLKVTRISTNEDGSPHYHYEQDPPDPSKPVVFTGPVKGPITLLDGTTYEVSPDFIEVQSHEHAGELSHHIGVRHETDGHPLHTDGEPFVHECTDACGPANRQKVSK